MVSLVGQMTVLSGSVDVIQPIHVDDEHFAGDAGVE
jgi:hypothetical protein